MPVAMLVDNPEGTADIYDKVRGQLGAEPAGSIFRIAGPNPDGGFRVINVWQSEEDAYRFLNERLKPAFEAASTTTHRRPTRASSPS